MVTMVFYCLEQAVYHSTLIPGALSFLSLETQVSAGHVILLEILGSTLYVIISRRIFQIGPLFHP